MNSGEIIIFCIAFAILISVLYIIKYIVNIIVAIFIMIKTRKHDRLIKRGRARNDIRIYNCIIDILVNSPQLVEILYYSCTDTIYTCDEYKFTVLTQETWGNHLLSNVIIKNVKTIPAIELTHSEKVLLLNAIGKCKVHHEKMHELNDIMDNVEAKEAFINNLGNRNHYPDNIGDNVVHPLTVGDNVVHPLTVGDNVNPLTVKKEDK